MQEVRALQPITEMKENRVQKTETLAGNPQFQVALGSQYGQKLIDEQYGQQVGESTYVPKIGWRINNTVNLYLIWRIPRSFLNFSWCSITIKY